MDMDNESNNEIVIKCEAATTLPLNSLLEFQGDLKKLTKKNRDKLMNSIIKHGFIAPIFVWCNDGKFMLLDGHQRLATLLYMQKEGWTIPDLPVALIEANNEKDAREKLLHITSAYGEFDEVELDKWLDDFDDDLADSIRLVEKEIDFNEINNEINSGSGRGGKYNDLVPPEINMHKLLYRIDAVTKINRNLCIELYAGRNVLTKWYLRYFKKVITIDKQKFSNINNDYKMKASDFIENKLEKYMDFDYIDFDDEGCPAQEIQLLFKTIKDKKKEPFILALTDGMGLNFKSRGKLNFFKTYMIKDNNVIQCTIHDYNNFEEIISNFILNVTKLNGFMFEELSIIRKDNGNVIYATYLVTKNKQPE